MNLRNDVVSLQAQTNQNEKWYFLTRNILKMAEGEQLIQLKK